MSGRITKVNGLEAIVKELNLHKADQFEVLQSRQAEVETSRAEMEVMRNRTKELEYQLREATDRCAMLEDSASSSRPKDRGRTAVEALLLLRQLGQVATPTIHPRLRCSVYSPKRKLDSKPSFPTFGTRSEAWRRSGMRLRRNGLRSYKNE